MELSNIENNHKNCYEKVEHLLLSNLDNQYESITKDKKNCEDFDDCYIIEDYALDSLYKTIKSLKFLQELHTH